MPSKSILLIIPINRGTMALRGYELYLGLVNANMSVSVAILNPKQEDGIAFDNEYYFNRRSNLVIRLIHRILWIKKVKRKIKPEISISVLNGCSVVSVLSGGKDVKIGQFRAPIEEEEDFFNKTLDRLAFKFIFSKLDQLYCVSEEIKYSIIHHYPKYEKRHLNVVPNLFNFERIRQLGKEEVHIPELENKGCIVHIGYFHPNKGQDRLIKAFSLLDDKIKQETKLIFIGEKYVDNAPQDYFANIVKLIDGLGLSDDVIFLGLQNNPYKFLNKADLAVVSSYKEGLPGSLVEALILQVPVIATNASRGVWEAMGVFNDYNPQLATIYKTPSGMITPNLSDLNVGYSDYDVNFLSDALTLMLDGTSLEYDFTSVNQFATDKIINKYINPSGE